MSHLFSSFPFFITPTPGVRPMARPPPLLGPGFRGQMRRAGRAHVCAKESGCRLQGTRVAGARAPHGARRSRARDPRTRAWPPACLASPSRALSSTVFATMFSSSMGCSAARPARPRRRPGPPTRAGADGDRRGSARLGSTDRAAASRALPASPATAARRALCVPPGHRCPPRPAFCLLDSVNGRADAPRAGLLLVRLFLLPRPRSRELAPRGEGAGPVASPIFGWTVDVIRPLGSNFWAFVGCRAAN